jgi:very-short-patch-repair endonuclease
VQLGRIESLYRGVYCFTAVPLSWRGRLLAACWAGGIRAYASHRSAAALWDLTRPSERIVEVTCPRWRRARHDLLVVHETKAYERADITVIDDVPVSNAARTLLDLGAVVSRWQIESALERALHKELVSVPELWGTLQRLGRQGRNGAGVLRGALVRRRPGRAAESDMEVRVIQLLRQRGLPTPRRQHVIRRGDAFVARVDLAYPQWKIAIEYDSIEHHSGAEALLHDSARRNAILAAGYVALVATVSDISDRCERLARTIRVLASRSVG